MVTFRILGWQIARPINHGCQLFVLWQNIHDLLQLPMAAYFWIMGHGASQIRPHGYRQLESQSLHHDHYWLSASLLPARQLFNESEALDHQSYLAITAHFVRNLAGFDRRPHLEICWRYQLTGYCHGLRDGKAANKPWCRFFC